MNTKTKIRALFTILNKDICVPIGPILAVQFFYEKISFYDIFNKHKSRSLDFNSLLIGLVSYKLTDNFSIKEASKWLTQRLFNIFWDR
jgi:transposase